MTDTRNKSCGGKTGQVEQEILRQIEIGNFQRGSLLPSERDLANRLNVSYMTVRRAIGNMVAAQLLNRIQGKGTYIREDVPQHRMQQTMGIILPAWETPEHADLMACFSELTVRNGLIPKYYLCRSWEDRAVREAYDNCDFLCLVPPAPLTGLPAELAASWRSGSKPVAVLGLDASGLGLDSVTGDNCTAAAIRELRRLGHRRIGQVTQFETKDGKLFRSTPIFYRNWFNLLRGEFSEAELASFEIPVRADAYSLPHEALYNYIMIHGRELPVTALLVPLSMCWGAIAAAADAGLRIPEQFSILAIGDRQEARFYRPRPSMIRVPYRRHVELVIEAFRRRQQDPAAAPRCFDVVPEYVSGDTVTPVSPIQ